MHHFTVITLFPELVEAYRAVGIVRRACESGLVDIAALNPRSFAPDRRGTVDDAPYGGGPGMVMSVPPLRAAIRAARARHGAAHAHVAYLSPQGRRFEQGDVAELAAHGHLVLVAGRYEGIDERVLETEIDEELSIGDYVLSGGELAALVVIDALARLLPGALGHEESARRDSFAAGLLDHAQYTRPAEIDGLRVPEVLLSGDHRAVEEWRFRQALLRTWRKRPDLLTRLELDERHRAWLREAVSGSGEGADPGHGRRRRDG